MPTDVRVIHSREFLKVTVKGELDLEQSRETLLQIASKAPSPENIDVLTSVREAPSQLTLSAIHDLAVEFTELRIAANRRTAVLCPPDRFDNAQFFAISASGMGRRVQAFTSFEEAFRLVDAGGVLAGPIVR